MFPEISILNLTVPIYPICVATGFFVGTLILSYFAKKYDFPEKLVFPLMCFTESGVIIGGKILFLLINFSILPKYYSKFGFLRLFTRTGFVFYGGLFGAIVSILLFSKIYNFPFSASLSAVCFVTPLVHFFGRLGCFFSGCCYGIEYAGFCSVYIHGSNRFPVQLVEAILNLLLFLVLQIILRKNKSVIFPYFLGYGIIRLVCESLRGDESRGFIGPLSVSAWISIMFIVMSFCVILIRSKNLLEKNRK